MYVAILVINEDRERLPTGKTPHLVLYLPCLRYKTFFNKKICSQKGRVYRVHYSERGEKPEEVFVLLSQCEGWKQVEEREREEDENRLKSKKKSKTTNWRV